MTHTPTHHHTHTTKHHHTDADQDTNPNTRTKVFLKAGKEKGAEQKYFKKPEKQKAMNGLKQAIQTNTHEALTSAIENAKKVVGFNPPELRTAITARGRLEVKGLGSGSG